MNYPRLRGDYAFPEARGVAEAPGDGFVPFSVTGTSSLANGGGGHAMTFQADDAEHGWLNDVAGIGEGSTDPDRAVLAMRCTPARRTASRASSRQPAGDRARA